MKGKKCEVCGAGGAQATWWINTKPPEQYNFGLCGKKMPICKKCAAAFINSGIAKLYSNETKEKMETML